MRLQKRLAAQVLRCGEGRVKFDPARLNEIKEAITTFDINRLIKKGAITKHQEKGVSRARAKKIAEQKSKGRRSGYGSRKGKKTARLNPKQKWIDNVRAQRELIKKLRDNKHVSTENYRTLYYKVKGGFFRSTKHIKLYIQEQDMVKK